MKKNGMLGDLAFCIFLIVNVFILFKTACLKYKLVVWRKVVSVILGVVCCLMCTALGLLWVMSWDEEMLHINNKLFPSEKTVDLGNGYYFMGGLPTIEYCCLGVKGFVYKGNIGYIEKEGVFSTPDGVFMYAGEYSENYIIARGVDYKGEVYYWLIMKHTDCIKGPLSADEVIVDCVQQNIPIVAVTSIQNKKPFLFK